MKRRTGLTAGCGAFFLAALVTACTSPVREPATIGDTIVIGTPEGTLASADNGATQLARALTAEGLTQISVDGRILPRLAKAWSWKRNDLQLHVTLQDNVTFHDGEPLNPQTVANLLTTTIGRAGTRALYPSLSDIVSIQPSEGNSIVFQLSRPSAFLLEELEIPLTTGTPAVGTGPFRLVSQSSQEIVLERFPQFRSGPAKIRRIVIKPIETLRTAWAELLRGGLDMVTDVPPDTVELIRNDDVQVISFARRYQLLVAFNSARKPLSSPNVRQALNLAVDRASLLERVLQGRGTEATGPIWPKFWGYDQSVGGYEYDPRRAQDLLDMAGYTTREPGNGERPPSRLRFTCIVPANFAVWERMALEVQKSLFNIGVDMELQAVPVAEFSRRLQESDFDAALIDMISGPTPSRSYIFWRSARASRGYNVFGYENPEAERQFELLRTSTNDAAIRAATRRLQRTFLDDPPALFLAWNERARAIRRDYAIPNEPGRDPLLTIWRWTDARSPSLLAATQ